MSKELTVPEILTKLSYIFSKDMYLIDDKYCIGGSDTEDENVGKAICVLTPEVSDLFIDYFGSCNVIFFENIKKAKAAFGTEDEYHYVNVSIEERNKKQLIDIKDNLMKIVYSVKGWDNFKFAEEQINSILTEGNKITLFENDKEIPEVTVSKSIFPLIKSKDFNDVYYTVFKSKNLKNTYTLILNYDHNIFQFYNIIYYLKEVKKKTNIKMLESKTEEAETNNEK